jgi:hypothetical protein
MNVPEFIAKWRGATLKERSASQSHFNDLCAALGVPSPTELDLHGEIYAFERGAEKSGGGRGWADVWRRGFFAWEYKGQHTNLYNQRPAWLANAHAALDRAVWAAYGWDDPDPAAVPEDAILARLLALNLERAAP